MLIKELMTREVRMASPSNTVQEAARMMREIDAGALPVRDNDRLVGWITDRDIVMRCVAEGKAPDKCRVHEVMSEHIKYVYEDESTEDLARNMSELQMRRLPVLDRNKRLVGIVSLGDLAAAHCLPEAQQAVEGISRGARAGLH